MAEKAGIREIMTGIFVVLGATVSPLIGKNIFNLSSGLVTPFCAGIGAVIGFGIAWVIGKFIDKEKKLGKKQNNF